MAAAVRQLIEVGCIGFGVLFYAKMCMYVCAETGVLCAHHSLICSFSTVLLQPPLSMASANMAFGLVLIEAYTGTYLTE